jgi:hypothetical protein
LQTHVPDVKVERQEGVAILWHTIPAFVLADLRVMEPQGEPAAVGVNVPTGELGDIISRANPIFLIFIPFLTLWGPLLIPRSAVVRAHWLQGHDQVPLL